MARLATIMMLAIVISSGIQLSGQIAVLAQTAPEGTVPTWVYMWVQRSDQAAEVWRGETLDQEWIQVGTIPGKVLDIFSTAADSSLAMALTNETIYRSNDAGETWQTVDKLPDWPTALALSQQTRGLMYLGTLNSGAFRSADAGITWKPLSPVVDPSMNQLPEVTALNIQSQDDAVLFMATGYWLGTAERHFTPQGIFMSLDAGETWLTVHESALNEPRVTALFTDVDSVLKVQAGTEDGRRWYVFGESAPTDKAPPDTNTQPMIALANSAEQSAYEPPCRKALARL